MDKLYTVSKNKITCIPVVASFRYMAKPIQYCKIKNKIKLKKKNIEVSLLKPLPYLLNRHLTLTQIHFFPSPQDHSVCSSTH